MAEKGSSKPDRSGGPESKMRVEGRVELPAVQREGLALVAYVYDRAGAALGSAAVSDKGVFTVAVALAAPADVEVVIGPQEDPQVVRRSAAVSRKLSAGEWTKAAGGYVVRPEIRIDPGTLQLLFPRRYCVSGHVRKITAHTDGTTEVCPVPYVKVEVFDVDREGCWWPFIRRWWELLFDRPVIRVPDLLREPRPFPLPIPDPIGPVIRGLTPNLPPVPGPMPDPRVRVVTTQAAGAVQPPPTGAGAGAQPLVQRAASGISANPMPVAGGRVGEVRDLEESVAARLDRLSLQSIEPPWVLFPRCFYSRRLVCEATTDCDGYFRCCFPWWPFHFRNGRLRFDSVPDIIIRVTQIINGVETVLYMDPYTSTRWNAGSTHIDLFLDDERIACGSGCGPAQPAGSPIFFTRIGHDEVYKIVQTPGPKLGLLDQTPFGGTLENWAYGGDLRIHAAIGQDLSDGTPKRFCRLQIRKGAVGTFKDIVRTLEDTRVHKTTFISQMVTLGPVSVGGVDNLYEIRDTAHYYWYSPDLIGRWNTIADELDEGEYTLRLEVFDDAGNHLTSAVVDYRDGTTPPPGPLPPLADRCEMKIHVDNKKPDFDFTVPGANACGIISCPAGPINVQMSADQENGRLWTWSLAAYKGLAYNLVGGVSQQDDSGISPLPLNVTQPFPSISITETCAYAITLGGWSLIRNGISVVHYAHVTKAIAVEKCS